MKVRINLSVENQVWKDFKKLCIDKDEIASESVQAFMEKKINGIK